MRRDIRKSAQSVRERNLKPILSCRATLVYHKCIAFRPKRSSSLPWECSTVRTLVTGATGLLGSHIAEKLVARGDAVRALVRPSADAAYFRELGCEIVTGDLEQPARLSSRGRGR